MAQKRINDLQLRSDFDETCNIPTDDLVQTWRITGQQILDFINSDIDKNAIRKLPISTKTTTYAILSSDGVILANAAGGAFSVSLPAANTMTGQVLYVKKIDSSDNAVTIDPNGSETIDGDTTLAISLQYQSRGFISDGSAWYIIS